MASRSKPTAITAMEDYEESCNILVYSHPGAGKTVFAGTCNGLILSTEKGLVSAKRFGSKADVWRINRWQDDPEGKDLVTAYEWLRDNPDHGYDWVVLDSLTRMQYLALRGLLEIAASENDKRDLDIPAIQDHQKWQNMMKRFIADFCELPVNVLFTALAMDVEDEEGDPLVMPFLLGKGYQISAWACGEMQMVGYLKVNKDKDGNPYRRLYVQQRPPHYAKDRYGIGDYVDNPTVPKLDALIKKALQNNGDGASRPEPKVNPTKAAPRKRAVAN